MRLTSTIIDLAIIYSLSIILQFIIWKFTFINYRDIFVTTYLAYYFFCYWKLKGRTLSKFLTGLKIVRKNNDSLSVKNVVLREIVLKGAFGIFIPLYFKTIYGTWSSLYTVLIIIIFLFLSVIFLFVFRRTWWELFSKTYTIRKSEAQKTNLKYAFIFIAAAIAIAVFININPLLAGKRNFTTAFYPKYPKTNETAKYAEFIKTHSQNPIDYVFDLFNHYDIVVISERLHPEYTQYEFISKLVSDERFIKNVGNIFTECGSVSFQDTLTSYLLTSFASEDQLNKSTAVLQRNSSSVWPLWSNTNLFDFFKIVNNLNKQLPDSSKISWYFTGMPVDWQTMNHEKFIKAYTNPAYDSIMAVHIILPFRNIISKQKRHKALVIMNTRHGYGLLNEKIDQRIRSEYNRGTTAYLMKDLPGKVANVMMNTVSIKFGYLFTPVQNGKWETAFSQAGNPDAGFNFNHSPLGGDNFDAAFLNTKSLTYKDVFTGFVFYKPLEHHVKKDGFQYEFENFEDTILKRAAYAGRANVEAIKKEIYLYKQNPKEPVYSELAGYAVLYNLVNAIILPILLFISLLIGLLFFLRRPGRST